MLPLLGSMAIASLSAPFVGKMIGSAHVTPEPDTVPFMACIPAKLPPTTRMSVSQIDPSGAVASQGSP
jgi:hypothetical protein